MLEWLLSIDRALFQLVNSNGVPFLDPFFLLLSAKATNVVVYLGVAVLVARKKHWSFFLSVLLTVGLMIAFTDQVTNLFKFGLERLRPCHEPVFKDSVRLVKESCGGLYSFFSGHASNSFALATFFSCFLKCHERKGGGLLFILATLIALSRVYLGVHYPLDIFCGALFGLFSGGLFWILGQKVGLPYVK